MVCKYASGLAVMLLAAALFVACGSDSTQPGEGQPTPGGPEGTAQASGAQTGTPQPVAQGGLDTACVQAVLGRPATGFSDITAAEREQVFRVCSPEGPPALPGQFTPVGPGGPVISAGIDFECASETLGREVTGFQDIVSLSEEDRAKVFEECSEGGVDIRPIDGSQFPGGVIQVNPGQGGGQFSGTVDFACV